MAGPPPPVVPGKIQVPDGNKVFLVGHAVGVQIYSCNATSNGFVWRFVAPRANLYDDHGKLIITHFGGPTWQAKDGSRVVGRLDGQRHRRSHRHSMAAAVAAVDDRLALTATGWWPRPTSNGSPPPAASRPPAADCNATTAGTVAEVPYTADYYFWKRTGG